MEVEWCSWSAREGLGRRSQAQFSGASLVESVCSGLLIAGNWTEMANNLLRRHTQKVVAIFLSSWQLIVSNYLDFKLLAILLAGKMAHVLLLAIHPFDALP
jgi:hypothetical protein